MTTPTEYLDHTMDTLRAINRIHRGSATATDHATHGTDPLQAAYDAVHKARIVSDGLSVETSILFYNENWGDDFLVLHTILYPAGLAAACLTFHRGDEERHPRDVTDYTAVWTFVADLEKHVAQKKEDA